MMATRLHLFVGSLFLGGNAFGWAPASPLAYPPAPAWQAQEGGIDSIPDLLAEGTLDERADACQSWITGLRAFKDIGGVYPKLRYNFPAWVSLNVDLLGEARLDRSAELCEALFDALDDRQTRKQHVAFIWSRTEVLRDRFASADRILDMHAALQAKMPAEKAAGLSATWQRAYYYIARGDLAFWRGLLDRAHAYKAAAEPEWESAVSMANEVHLRTVRREIDRLATDIALGRNQSKRALTLSRQSLKAIADSTDPSWPADSAKAKTSSLWTRYFRNREAVALYRMALRDAAATNEAISALRGLLDDPETSASMRFDTAINLWELYLGAGELDLAAEERERANSLAQTSEQLAVTRALELTEATLAYPPGGAATDAFDRWRGAFESMLEQWLDDPPRSAGSSLMAYNKRRYVLWAGINSLLERGDAAGALDLYLQTERVGSLSRLLRDRFGDHEALTARAVQEQLLTPGEVVLIPVRLSRGSLMFVLERDDVQCLEIEREAPAYPVARELESLVNRPAAEGEDAASRLESIDALAERLRSLVMPDSIVDTCLNASLLTVVDDHVLGRLPLDLVRVNGKLLCQQVPMAEVTSLDVRASLARRPLSTTELDVSVVTNVPSSTSFERSVKTGLEPLRLGAEATSRLLPPDPARARLYTESDATEEDVRDSILTSAAVVTFVAHGFADYKRERPATLWLGTEGDGDGLLTAAEVESLDSIASVVLLATCGAASGAYRAGDAGAGHLGGALTMAGARSVILASGDLPVAATLLATERIQHHLLSGESVASAVLLARNEVAAQAQHKDPSAYAQLRVYGLGDHVPFPDAGAGVDSVDETLPGTSETGEGGSRELPLTALAGGLLLVIAGVILALRLGAGDRSS